jgi:hypothetical protein
MRYCYILKWAAFLILFILVFESISDPFTYRLMGNRREGIIERENVSGESGLVFLGINVITSRTIDSNSDSIKLTIIYPTISTVQVKVWEPKFNYFMQPLDQFVPVSGGTFSWSTNTVLKPKGITFQNLISTCSTKDGILFIPAILWTGKTIAPRRMGYLFKFKATGKVNFKATIAKKTIEGFNIVGESVFSMNSGIVSIEWDGLRDSGKPANPGIYRLSIDGAVSLQTKDESVQQYYDFYLAQ